MGNGKLVHLLPSKGRAGRWEGHRGRLVPVDPSHAQGSQAPSFQSFVPASLTNLTSNRSVECDGAQASCGARAAKAEPTPCVGSRVRRESQAVPAGAQCKDSIASRSHSPCTNSSTTWTQDGYGSPQVASWSVCEEEEWRHAARTQAKKGRRRSASSPGCLASGTKALRRLSFLSPSLSPIYPHSFDFPSLSLLTPRFVLFPTSPGNVSRARDPSLESALHQQRRPAAAQHHTPIARTRSRWDSTRTLRFFRLLRAAFCPRISAPTLQSGSTDCSL